MTKITVGKCAPEDSSQWKCNWIECLGGCGLSGNGRCADNGEWDNPSCPKFNKVPEHMYDKPMKKEYDLATPITKRNSLRPYPPKQKSLKKRINKC